MDRKRVLSSWIRDECYRTRKMADLWDLAAGEYKYRSPGDRGDEFLNYLR